MTAPTDRSGRGRHLSGGAFAAIVVVYLVIIQGGGLLVGHGSDAFRTTRNLVETGLIPIGVSCVFAIGVATWLGWWPRIWREGRPATQTWTRIVPIALLIAALLGAIWGSLLDQEADLILALVAMVLLVGFTEELMFRGIGLNTFRDMRLTETRVALTARSCSGPCISATP